MDLKEVGQEVKKEVATHLAARQPGLRGNGSTAQQVVGKLEQSTGTCNVVTQVRVWNVHHKNRRITLKTSVVMPLHTKTLAKQILLDKEV